MARFSLSSKLSCFFLHLTSELHAALTKQKFDFSFPLFTNRTKNPIRFTPPSICLQFPDKRLNFPPFLHFGRPREKRSVFRVPLRRGTLIFWVLKHCWEFCDLQFNPQINKSKYSLFYRITCFSNCACIATFRWGAMRVVVVWVQSKWGRQLFVKCIIDCLRKQ